MPNVYYLKHHGIKGQKWGVRRFETESGQLTSAGKKRYNTDSEPKKGISAGKAVAIGLGGAAAGAAAVGTAWYLKNKANIRAINAEKAARTAKAQATKSAKRAMGLYNKVKGSYVDPVSGMVMQVKMTAQNLSKIASPMK